MTASYEHYGPRAGDRASDMMSSQERASAGHEDVEEAWRAPSGSPHSSRSGSQPQHQPLSRNQRKVSRSRCPSSSRSSFSRRESVTSESRDDFTPPGRGRRRESRGKRRVCRHFGTGDSEPRRERIDRWRNNREADEHRSDSGAQRNSLEDRKADPRPREERHARRHSRSRGRRLDGHPDCRSADQSPREARGARRSGDRAWERHQGGRSTAQSPREERRPRRSGDQRWNRARSASTSSSGSSSA